MKPGRPPPTHYDVLEVSRDASPATIRAAYKSLMQRYHPDRVQTPEAQERARRINVAYDVLSDVRKRDAYDATLAPPSASATGTPPPPPGATGKASGAASNAASGAAAPGNESGSALARLRRAWAWLALAALVPAAALALWWLGQPQGQRPIVVGTVRYDPGSPEVQVLALPDTILREGDSAEVTLLFRAARGQTFRVNGVDVAAGSSRVRYDCAAKTFVSTQNRMQLPDASAIELPDSEGPVMPTSAQEGGMRVACGDR